MSLVMKSIFRVSILSLSLICRRVVPAQDLTSSVSGTVICNDGNTPGRGAKVTLIPLDQLLSQGSGAGSKSTTSDFNGMYEMRSVSPGMYIVNATLEGYDDDLKLVLSALDTVTPDEKKKIFATFPQVIVKSGVIVRKDLVLRRAAAISGRVAVDLGGTPGRVMVSATRINAGSASSVGAHSKESEPFSQSSPSDDRGTFRIAGLPAGKYRISLRITEAYFASAIDSKGGVRVQPERPGTAELQVYAPEVLEESQARTIEVNDGDEITDADITVPTRLLHSIAGIAAVGGAPAAGISIILVRPGGSIQGYSAVSLPDGSFRFDLLSPGNYVLRARDGSSSISGETSVQLSDSDVLDANIDLHGRVNPTH